MIVRAPAAAAGLLGVLSAVAIGCGSDSALLGQNDAADLKGTLAEVRSAVDARDCSLARARLRELRTQRDNLPGSVDRRLRMRLREEIVGKLAPAIEDECDSPKTEAQPTVTTEAPTGPTGPPPTPEPEPTPPPPTEKTETTPPPTQPTETTPPPDDPEAPPVPDPVPKDPTRDPGGFGDGSKGPG